MQRALWRRNASGDRDEDPETNEEAPNRAGRLPTAKGIAPRDVFRSGSSAQFFGRRVGVIHNEGIWSGEDPL